MAFNFGNFLGDLIGAGSSLISSAFGVRRQERANKANLLEADINRQWMERMSSTAHQRQVDDLRKAGLNPILSANTGASMVSPAMGRVESSAKNLSQNMQLATLASQIALNNSAKKVNEIKIKTGEAVLPKIEAQSSLLSDVYKGIRSIFASAGSWSGKRSVALENAFRMKKRR